MNKIKYLITTLFVMMLLCLYANGNEALNSASLNSSSSSRMSVNFPNVVLVFNNINSMGRVIDTVKYPFLNKNINKNSFEGREEENKRIINFAGEIIIDGDDADIKNRRNPIYSDGTTLYSIFNSVFRFSEADGDYQNINGFNVKYATELKNNNNSLSNTVKAIIKDITEHNERQTAVINNLFNGSIDNLANSIWVQHASKSIQKKLLEYGTNNEKSIFVLLPPKLSADQNNILYTIRALGASKILRLKDETDFLFKKTIAPSQNIYNILIDGHHTNHIKAPLKN